MLPLVLLLLPLLSAAEYQCLFHQLLEPRKAYTIASPGFPARYQPGESCQWIARSADSSARVVLDCDVFELPPPKGGQCGDALWVSASGRRIVSDGEPRCGSGRFTLVSSGPRLNLKLVSLGQGNGGLFRCSVAATDPKGVQRPPVVTEPFNPPKPQPQPTKPLPQPPLNPSRNCSCAARRFNEVTRVVGGAEAGPHEYPLAGYLEDAEAGRLLCGAALLSQWFALTAAHCAELAVSPKRVNLVVGDHDRSQPDWKSRRQTLRVRDFIVHPDYSGTWGKGDIAVVRLQDAASLGSAAQPACLPFSLRKSNLAGQPVTVVGWGGEKIGGPNSVRLRVASLQVVKNSACAKTYGPSVSDNHMCAFRRDASPCSGDSGGPLIWESPSTGSLILVGIVSYGEGCPSDKPVINTRVSQYLRWIQQTTRESYCHSE